MKLVIFGLAVSSSWGNGHATLWRSLISALVQQGHTVDFFERDVPYYAENRDLADFGEFGPRATLTLYREWADIAAFAQREADAADAALVTSFCPDGIAATSMVLGSRARARCFYDLDTPVTLDRLAAGHDVPYVGADGLAGFDLVLSYTGGGALDALRTQLGARHAVPFYGWADPAVYRAVPAQARYRADCSYLGTYAADRQATLERLFVGPARRLPGKRFVIGGAQYPADFPWTDNIFFVRHLPPAEHPAFYSSSRMTLNVTRAAMARMGWCPSGRLFEAAACGTPILSDAWQGLENFFEPGRELLLASGTEEAMAALETSPDALVAMARRARDRVLAEHTAEHRARTLIDLLQTEAVGA